MLKLKNLAFLLFCVSVTLAFLFINTKGQRLPEFGVAAPSEKGRVLGVSEDKSLEDATEDPAVKRYIDTEEAKKVVPVVDKSSFVPLRKEGSGEPQVSGGSMVAIDAGSGGLLYGEGENKQRPIASISKLMTALVLMDLGLDWNGSYKIKESDRIEGGRVYVKVGEEIKLKDLLYAGLVASDNTAVRSLVSASGLTYKEFIEKMNKKAQSLGLSKTSFSDPVGISRYNVSTALEVAKFAQEAISNGVIRDCLLRQKYVFQTVAGASKTISSTDLLLDDFQNGIIQILGGKTGSTDAAGYCFAAMFENADGKKIVTAVLGNDSPRGRFSETKKLADWAYDSYEWRR